MTNICKSTVTLEQYYSSCPNNVLIKDRLLQERLLEDSHFAPVFYCSHRTHNPKVDTLIYLKSFFEGNGYIDYIKNPQKTIDHGSRKPTLPQNDVIKTEFIKVFHGLWLTNKQKPHIINSALDNFIVQSKKLNDYKVIMWTNIPSDKLREMNPQLDKENIITKNIADIKTDHTNLLDFIISPKEYINFKNSSTSGLVIDITKYIIMESQGGVIADLNFRFEKNFQQSSIEYYDFIAEKTSFNAIENGFFVATAHHPIFIETLNIIDEMINSPDCSLHELKAINALRTIELVDLFSMMPLSMSYISSNNQKGKIDALFIPFGPYQSLPDKSNQDNHRVILLNATQVQQHEEKVAQLDSSDLKDFGDYVSIYHELLCKGAYSDNNYFTEALGKDGHSNTWQHTDIN